MKISLEEAEEKQTKNGRNQLEKFIKQTSTDTKNIDITPCILSDHHGLKLESNNNTKL